MAGQFHGRSSDCFDSSQGAQKPVVYAVGASGCIGAIVRHIEKSQQTSQFLTHKTLARLSACPSTNNCL